MDDDAAVVVTPTCFRAPWGREVTWMTVAGVLIIGTPVVIQLLRGYWLVAALLLTLLVVSACLSVRGYQLAPGELRVRRLFWDTSWPLDPDARAFVRPSAMTGSWRTWGNGGLFAITGQFSGSGLGRYTAFVTDPAATVVLETRRGIVVVSPDNPAAFVEAAVRASRAARD